MASKESGLIFEAYMEAKEAPKGRHYTKGGQLRKGDADSDGRGGPKFRSAPTYVNPNDEEVPEEDFAAFAPIVGTVVRALAPAVAGKIASKFTGDEEEKPAEEDDLGLGPNTPSMIRVTSIGSTTPHSKVRSIPNIRGAVEDEAVFIQAGPVDDECGHNQHDEYDGEVDMARADLLKAQEYSTKLFDHIANVDSLDGWVAAKITKASDYLSSVFHHLDYQDNHDQVEDEQDAATTKGVRPLNFRVDNPEIEDGE